MTVVGLLSPASQNSGRGIGFYVDNLFPHLSNLANAVGIEVRQTYTISPQFDLIHYPFFDLFQPTLKLQSGTKTVVTVHDVIPLQYPNVYRPGLIGQINHYRQKLQLNRVHHLITDSNASKVQIQKLLTPKDVDISVIHLAPADHFFQSLSKLKCSQLTKHFNLPQKFVLYVGDINYNKNLPTLFEACKQSHLHLVIAGKSAKNITQIDTSHPETVHLKSLLDHLSSRPEDISLLGYVSDEVLSALYRQCSVYCQPSFYEGFGLTPLEAMACGAPVICSQTPALTEITAGNCLYFDPYSVNDLVDKIKLALSGGGKIRDLARQGFRHASTFSWSQTARQTLNVYRHLLKV